MPFVLVNSKVYDCIICNIERDLGIIFCKTLDVFLLQKTEVILWFLGQKYEI